MVTQLPCAIWTLSVCDLEGVGCSFRYFWLSSGFSSRRTMESNHFKKQKAQKRSDKPLLHCCLWQKLRRRDYRRISELRALPLPLEFFLADSNPSTHPHDIPSPLQSFSTVTPSQGMEVATVLLLPTESSKISGHKFPRICSSLLPPWKNKFYFVLFKHFVT